MNTKTTKTKTEAGSVHMAADSMKRQHGYTRPDNAIPKSVISHHRALDAAVRNGVRGRDE